MTLTRSNVLQLLSTSLEEMDDDEHLADADQQMQPLTDPSQLQNYEFEDDNQDDLPV